jgi:hypothetical protein
LSPDSKFGGAERRSRRLGRSSDGIGSGSADVASRAASNGKQVDELLQGVCVAITHRVDCRDSARAQLAKRERTSLEASCDRAGRAGAAVGAAKASASACLPALCAGRVRHRAQRDMFWVRWWAAEAGSTCGSSGKAGGLRRVNSASRTGILGRNVPLATGTSEVMRPRSGDCRGCRQ